ncbi:MAG: hypothetical protein A3G33_05795 [Omnitrophica bacterium RIFCSPLOWO2_12_FULL_44_17]|uniref:Type II secretion system protein GspI C-terminal domain-containing protein n=1 Tax=Candidatus Danuiimicrobium aquiferis TaxID=1801832 RepID=A0A1G1L378_9BACT|nr:MAG: hypothetical protein A3B72_08270 [Omnitrophica bacterium RIFCSPHIGHO2_02_FULL_45_28]OGW99584.1 MAG: hypothetical protein A3G33_05795 [Omnitrophica bacterium RIFCSPLOWO2_12_FULL_44_17]OGX03618.1 MAG: hypothetical protein A3J12_05550 [Omnitrophica bacterium RIFCSPLOWO2_02_FULL_44_11]
MKNRLKLVAYLLIGRFYFKQLLNNEKRINEMNKTNSKTGFTLMETVIAIGLFAIALFGILSLIDSSLSLGEFSENRSKAINKARQVMEEVRTVIENNGLSITHGADSWATWISANISSTIPSEQISVTFPGVSGTIPNPLPVKVNVSWSEKGKMITHSVEALMTNR